MNNELLIRIKDIYTFINYIYKSIELNYNINIIDFKLNNKEVSTLYIIFF